MPTVLLSCRMTLLRLALTLFAAAAALLAATVGIIMVPTRLTWGSASMAVAIGMSAGLKLTWATSCCARCQALRSASYRQNSSTVARSAECRLQLQAFYRNGL